MPRTLSLLVADHHGPVVFPARCAGCGRASDTASTLAFAKVVTRRGGAQAPVQRRLAVPHCAACARTTKAVFLASLVPFLLGLFAVGGAVFLAVWYRAAVFGFDEMGRPQDAYSLVLGAAAGLLAGVAGGFVCELLARVVLLPVMGRALWRAPLFAGTLLTDVDYVAGVTGRPNADLSAVTLRFELDDVADAVRVANADRIAPADRPC